MRDAREMRGAPAELSWTGTARPPLASRRARRACARPRSLRLLVGIAGALGLGLAAPVPAAQASGPTIVKIEPTKGATEGGTLVTITGASLAGATGVKFGSTNATTFTVNSPTSMNAVSPAGSGTVDITVTTPEGTSPTSSADRFAYEPPQCFGEGRGHNPLITAVEPSSGPAESSLTIKGENFSEVICGDIQNNVRRVIFGAEEAGWSKPPGGSFNFLTFDHLKTHLIGGRGSDDTIQNSDIGNDPTGPAINIVEGDRWHIISNHIHDTGDSGILTQSAEEGTGQGANGILIEGNTIENTGSDSSTTYGKHGIYLKVRNAMIVNNTITNCLAANADGISVRYGNSTIIGNHISKCPEGIGFFQYDHEAGTSNWIENVISETTEAGIYVSSSDVGGKTRESFVIERNTIGPLTSGVYMNLGETTGTYTAKENTLLGVGGTASTGTSGGGVTGETGGGPAFYVSPNGSDSNPGTITEPWRTVGRVNSATLPAGSTVYFQGGASFAGTLVGNAGGEAGKPITYSSYGTGDATIGEVSVGGGSPGLSGVAPVGAGTVDVRVEMQNGATSAITSADRFTYTKPVPSVTKLTPDHGPPAGGTSVTVTGTNFLGATAVRFGSTAATSFTVNSRQSITAVAPSGTGIVDVTVTTPEGTSATNAGDRFTYGQPPPTVETGPANFVTQSSAKLYANVNPDGGEANECKLEYGTTSSYGKSAPCTPSPGSGESRVEVSAAIGGLSPSTTYHYRISAANAGGTSNGSDQRFRTLPNPPTVETKAATSVTQTSATVTASVNPNGAEGTSCTLEYGLTTSYGQSAPCTPAPGSGTSPVAVSAALESLAEGATYHFRVGATSAGGTNVGSDATFKTTLLLGPHWYKNHLRLAESALENGLPVMSWGSLTLENAKVGALRCLMLAGGDLANPVGGGAGKGVLERVTFYDCEAPSCEAAKGLQVLIPEKAEWSAVLIEEPATDRDRIEGIALREICVGGESTVEFHGMLKPSLEAGTSIGSAPAKLEFGAGSGELQSVEGASKVAGKLKFMGYETGEIIGAKKT